MADGTNVQLPSTMVAKEFGEVNVRRAGPDLEIYFTILMEPQGAEAEGWQTGVALDVSSSMKSAYGRSLRGDLPPDVAADYARHGWMTRQQSDGRAVQRFTDDGRKDATARGYLTPTPNTVEPLARDFIAYLAGNLDADGGTTVIYWAAGDGSAFEVVGDFTADQCKALRLEGPKQHRFGTGTRLTPAVRYFVDRFADAARGMYLFLTDGRLDDLDAVKTYTTDLCRRIAAGRRNPVKCVLIGVGGHIQERQMEELDDLDTGTGIDVWDHKIAADMRGVIEIFAEVVGENQIVAPTARVFDAGGRVVKQFADGLPAAVTFRMPAASAWFELEVAGERIRQPVVTPPPPLPGRR